MATHLSCRPAPKGILKGAASPAGPQPQPAEPVSVDAIDKEHASQPWNEFFNSEEFRVAACSVVMCVLLSITVVVLAFVFYATPYGGDEIPESTAKVEEGATESTTTTAGRDVRSSIADHNTKSSDAPSFPTTLGQDSTASKVSVGQDSTASEVSEIGNGTTARQELVNASATPATFATSSEQAATQSSER